MAIGKKWESEKTDFKDAVTGVQMSRLTTYKCNHNHLYFTNPGWYDNGKKLIICGDRDNRTNLLSLDLDSYEITQVTDLPEYPLPFEHCLHISCVDGVRNMAYLVCGRDFLAVDLHTFMTRKLWTLPEGYMKHVLSCSQDSDYLYTSIYEDLSDLFPIDIERGYIGFKEIFEHHPLSKIIRIRTDGSGAEPIWEEHNWIGHVNVAPHNADKITFCHEGPWNLIDHRIWGMDVLSGKIWKIHPSEPDETIGHEYWYEDSEHIGYHGARQDGRSYLGKIGFDNTGKQEAAFSNATGHIHSLDQSLIVGDGGIQGSRFVSLWKWDGQEYIGPKALCEHCSSSKTQREHVHPRLTPDGKSVLFTSDRSGYGSVYLAQIPEFETLPDLGDVL